MQAKWMGYGLALALVLLLAFRNNGTAQPPVPGGELHILDQQEQTVGACPLKHTAIEASIHGFFSRVRVRQIFYNPLETKIEAVYTFPLPQDAAVDDMVMTVGERRIVGQIRPRDEARALYEAGRAAGHDGGWTALYARRSNRQAGHGLGSGYYSGS
jgi:hypothetical protein